ncbi:MAG: hypothetical protein U0903_20280 [Planctomycetales bacterium]
MKNVGPVRRQLKFRTIFNLVGPLTNPAGADYQLLGVNQPEIGRLLAEASRLLGRKHAFIVSAAEKGWMRVHCGVKQFSSKSGEWNRSESSG